MALKSVVAGMFAVIGAACLATAAVPSSAGEKLPPLIPREVFFGDPDIAAPQISPDGQQIAFIRPYQGTRSIWVKRTEESFDRARPITAETTPVAGYFWSRDGKYVLYARDNAGDENFNVYAVDPTAKPDAQTKVPPARNLTNTPGARVFIYAVPETAPDLLYVGVNDRDPAWHDVYRVKISTGEKELILKNTDRFTGVHFDLKDNLRLVSRSAPNGDTEILAVENGAPQEKIYSCSVFESCSPVQFHLDGKRAYFATNRGADTNFIRLTLVDVQNGSEETIESDPEQKVDLAAPLFSQKTDELIGTAYQGDERTRIYWRNDEHRKRYEFVQSRLKDKEIGWVSQTPDERLALILARSDVEPGEVHLYEHEKNRLTFQFRIREELPRDALARMKAIRYRSSDGLEIPAYLTLPANVPAKSLPLLVLPHGGPWARDGWGYHPLAQFFANRGFAVLMPNFRGSVGYGKKFLDAGDRQWGEKMQDDLTWGVKHLVAEGIADPKRVAIFGGSYGGYATLAGVAFTPDVYAAAVSLVGPSNLITLLNSIPPYWEAGRKLFSLRLGDVSTPEGRAQLQRQSPLNSADKIKTPLMVVQGANDPRVKTAESEQIVVALRDRNFPVEYLLAKDEGHGFSRPENNIAAFAAIEQFFAKHVPGIRYQAEMSEQTRAQLQKLIVDPKTVKLEQYQPPSKEELAQVIGDWEGALQVSPTATLRLVLHIAADAQEGVRATMDSPDQGAVGLPVSSVKVSAGQLKFEMPQIAGRYEGTLGAERSSISGTWSQGGASLPLVWQRKPQ